jgi:O-antigen/teichoic acid export membrane protein
VIIYKVIKNYFPIYALIIGVQGFPICLQVMSKFMLDSNEFATVRSIESLISILLMFAVWGTPTLAIRLSIIHKQYSWQIFATLICIPIYSLLISSPIIYFLSTDFLRLFDNKGTVSLVVFLGLASCVRICSALIQGSGSTDAAIKSLVITFVVCLIIAALELFIARVGYWVYLRVGCEILILISLLKTIWGVSVSKEFTALSKFKLWKQGGLINAALVIRSVIDNLPLLILYRFGADVGDTSDFAAATLALMFPMLICGIYSQKQMPAVMNTFLNDNQNFENFEKIKKKFIILGCVVLIAFLCSIVLLDKINPRLFNGMISAVTLSILIPIRQVCGFYGMVFMASESYRATIVQNIFELIVFFFAMLLIGFENSFQIIVSMIIAGFASLFYCVNIGSRIVSKRSEFQFRVGGG